MGPLAEGVEDLPWHGEGSVFSPFPLWTVLRGVARCRFVSGFENVVFKTEDNGCTGDVACLIVAGLTADGAGIPVRVGLGRPLRTWRRSWN